MDAEVTELQIKKLDDQGMRVKVTLPPPEKCAIDVASGAPKPQGQLLHLILEVTDDGVPSLTSYRRVLIQATNKELRGGGHNETAVDIVMRDPKS